MTGLDLYLDSDHGEAGGSRGRPVVGIGGRGKGSGQGGVRRSSRKVEKMMAKR